MKRVLVWGSVLAAFLLVAGLLALGFLRRGGTAEKEQEPTPSTGASPIRRSPTGEVSLILDRTTQQRIGLQSATLVATNVVAEIKGYGRVLDPSPIATLANELATAHAAWDASRKEFERLKTLQQQTNASARALQTAEAAARRDELQVRSAKDRLTLGYGPGLAQEQDLPEFVQNLITLSNLLIRVDLPAGDQLHRPPSAARFQPLASESDAQAAEFFGKIPTVDPQMQGESYLFLSRTNSLGLVGGAAVTGYLRVAGTNWSGVLVPRSAVVRFESKPWVYVEMGGTNFVRRPVILEHALEAGWLVTSGLSAETRIVIVGAQELLSTELTTSSAGE